MHECKKETVLIVHNYYQIPGGEDTVVANEKRLLEEHGHEVVLYSRSNSELKNMSMLKKLLLPFTTVFNYRTYRDVKRIIKEQKIDVVHVHNTLNLISPAVYYAATSMKVPVVQTIHNFRLLCPGATFYRDGHICEDCVEKGLHCAVKHSCYRDSKLQTLICVVSTKIHRMTGIYGKLNYICLTEFNKEKLKSLKQIEAERIFVKPNFAESQASEIIPFDKRENRYIFAGRLDKLKGIDYLLKAWKQMGDKAPKLIVCGTGPMEQWCKSYIKENSVNAEMKGFVPNADVKQLIAKSKALILPTQWYEGFPMSIVESFSVGTPVICSDLGNAGCIVTEGISGCKFKANSTEDLIKAIERLEENYSTKLAENICSLYCENFSQQSNYEILTSIYNDVIS